MTQNLCLHSQPDPHCPLTDWVRVIAQLTVLFLVAVVHIVTTVLKTRFTPPMPPGLLASCVCLYPCLSPLSMTQTRCFWSKVSCLCPSLPPSRTCCGQHLSPHPAGLHAFHKVEKLALASGNFSSAAGWVASTKSFPLRCLNLRPEWTS